MRALEACVGPLFSAIFALLGRLEEIESQVRLLQLVSICVEVLGEAAQPHLRVVAAALPQAHLRLSRLQFCCILMSRIQLCRERTSLLAFSLSAWCAPDTSELLVCFILKTR
jgi:hypothetical protein